VDCNDEVVFARAQAGDRSAFGLLVHRHQDRAYSIALRLLRHQEDAQDAVQQAFLAAWQKRHTYHPRGRFRTWLYRIVTNVCIDTYRRQQRRQQAPDSTLSTLAAPHSPASDYERRECYAAFEAALARLPVEARTVLVLCYLDGFSYAEVARIRGITVHTVKSQLRRAKALLRQHLTPHVKETS
jgi:RNA polymerase sigma-70 factor (ECF subfamily)